MTPAEACWVAVSILLVGRAGCWVSWETFSFQQLNSCRPLLRKLMNSPTWGRGKAPLPLQALLWAGRGASLGPGWVEAGPTSALENRCALGSLRRVVGRAVELLMVGVGRGTPAFRAVPTSLEPGAEAPEGTGGRRHLEPWGQEGCPASSLGPC